MIKKTSKILLQTYLEDDYKELSSLLKNSGFNVIGNSGEALNKENQKPTDNLISLFNKENPDLIIYDPYSRIWEDKEDLFLPPSTYFVKLLKKDVGERKIPILVYTRLGLSKDIITFLEKEYNIDDDNRVFSALKSEPQSLVDKVLEILK